jgi:soluble lytic murein transglycosylase-like protein
MWTESGGRHGLTSSSGAVGLMQVLPSAHPEFDRTKLARSPEYNIAAGARLLGDSYRAGWDLVAAASRYNAGARPSGAPHPASGSRWGYRHQGGYIDAVVRSNNYLVRLGRPSRVVAGVFGVLGALAAGAGAWGLGHG